ncbi:MAG: hypothetical protein H6734_09640 [Alphaproteobacteria bacterium]|nr:hypothetical protein [Alphaproteobacteria bacterium]
MWLLVMSVATAGPVRVIDPARAFMGCLVEVGGVTTTRVDLRGHFEIDDGSVPAKVRLVCADRSKTFKVGELPAELNPDGRPQVRPWVLPQEEVARALARFDAGLPGVVTAVGALAEAGTAATSGGSLHDVAAAAARLRTETRALEAAVDLTEQQLDGDEKAIARHGPVLAWVRDLDRRAGEIEELTADATNPMSLVLVAGKVQLMTAALMEAERFRSR